MSEYENNASSTGMPSGSAPAQPPTFDCRACGATNSRQQELDRHYQTFHLPYWMFCPLEGCKWRAGRNDELNKHLATHQYDQKPTEEQYQIYNVKMILDMIKEEGDNFPRIVQLAINLVKERALELGRREWLTEPWGRSLDRQQARHDRRIASRR